MFPKYQPSALVEKEQEGSRASPPVRQSRPPRGRDKSEQISVVLFPGTIVNMEEFSRRFTGKKSLVQGFLALLFGILIFGLGSERFREAPLAIAQDSSPPKISEIKIEVTTATSAIVSWKTDELADSLINYGITSDYGIAHNPKPLVREHKITIPELDPSTAYFFRVASVDSTGNQSFSGNHVFTTKGSAPLPGAQEIAAPEERLATEKIASLLEGISDAKALELISEKTAEVAEGALAPPQILGAPELEIGAEQAVVSWRTDKDSNSIVRFSTEDEYGAGGGSYAREEGASDAFTRTHEVTLHGLRPATRYHFELSSKGRVGPAAKSTDRTFVTKALTPQIYEIRIDKVEEYAATVSWSTSIPSAALVEYANLRTGETKSIGNPTFLASHSVRLTGLEFKTPYSVLVKARNQAGEEIVGSSITFITTKDEAPPKISRVSNESTLYPGADAKIQTIIGWDTDEASVCQLFYGQGLVTDEAGARSLPEEAHHTTAHVQVVTEFTPSTVYKFWVTCKDRNGNQDRSEDFVLFTPEKEKNIIDIILENFEGTFGWVKDIGK